MHQDTSLVPVSQPQLLDRSVKLADYVKTLTAKELSAAMNISAPLAEKTRQTFEQWNTKTTEQTAAIDCFRGDIYSGLQAAQLNEADRMYAQKTLVILSGLYGLLRPLDGIMPYRLEMMYQFARPPFDNLYHFWGHSIADLLPKTGLIFNTSSAEYSKLVLPFVDNDKVITPLFYTKRNPLAEPTFVTVHSKIARGAFARWLLTTKITSEQEAQAFNLLGYSYAAHLSKPKQPAFVTDDFGGIGLSVRGTA